MDEETEFKYTCRYCLDGSNEYDNFISPCECKGSSEFVHKNCLKRWLESKNGTTHYNTCSECHSNFKRRLLDGIDETIEEKVLLTSILGESIFAFFIVLTILICFLAPGVCMFVLLIIYLITLSYLINNHYSDMFVWVTIIAFFVIWWSPPKIKLFGTLLWLIITFCLISYSYITEGWTELKCEYKKLLPPNIKPEMFDYYLNNYVDGVV